MVVSTAEPGTNTSIDEVSYRLSIRYESNYGQYIDNLYIQQINIRAVIETLPAAIRNDLTTLGDETSKTYDYIRGKLFNNDDQVQIFAIAAENFVRHPGHSIDIEPRYGRFYPATLFNSEKLSMTNRMIPIRIIDYMLNNEQLSGPFNLVSPQPVTNYAFTKSLGRALHRPTILPVPAVVARMMFGEMADALLLSSSRVAATRLNALGYTFVDNELDQTLFRLLDNKSDRKN